LKRKRLRKVPLRASREGREERKGIWKGIKQGAANQSNILCKYFYAFFLRRKKVYRMGKKFLLAFSATRSKKDAFFEMANVCSLCIAIKCQGTP
jgi:hypothetical protein